MDPGRLPGFSYENRVHSLKEIIFPISAQMNAYVFATWIGYENCVPGLKEIVFLISIQLNESM